MKCFLTLLLLLSSFTAQALEVPTLKSPVMDQAGVMNSNEKNQLESQIRQIWEVEKQVQISVLIIPSLEGEIIEEYSIKVAEKWQLGTKKEDNGLLILIAMQDRKMRIEVGNGIEGVITDAKSRRMIENMKPYLRNKDVHGAVKVTVDHIHQLMKANSPEALAAKAIADKEAAERQAEQDKIDAEQRALRMSQMANIAVWALIVVLFLVAVYNLYDNFIQLPKEMKSLKSDKEITENRIKNENANLSEQRNKLQGLKVDRTKLAYLKSERLYQDLEGRKSQLISSIKTMKNYLGVK